MRLSETETEDYNKGFVYRKGYWGKYEFVSWEDIRNIEIKHFSINRINHYYLLLTPKDEYRFWTKWGELHRAVFFCADEKYHISLQLALSNMGINKEELLMICQEAFNNYNLKHGYKENLSRTHTSS